jgi:hypothetical protein
MTQPEETTAALIARLHEELAESNRERDRATNERWEWHTRAQKTELERDEQRARAEKAEWALGAEVERCIAEKRQGDMYWRQIDDARKKLGETKSEVEGGRSLTLCVLDVLRKVEAAEAYVPAMLPALKARAEAAEANYAVVDRLLVERTRERDEARAKYNAGVFFLGAA